MRRLPEIRVGRTRVQLFAQPPEGFDPRSAHPRQLLKYGIPRRPHPERERFLYEAWLRAFSRKLNYVRPRFLYDPLSSRLTGKWAGSVVVRPKDELEQDDPFQWVNGEWTVPNPCLPATAQVNVQYLAALWVGIDGGATPTLDLLQAGTDSLVWMGGGGNTHRETRVWWEWVPDHLVLIPNFPVAAGDVMRCLICALSRTQASIFMSNLNTQDYTAFTVSAPAGTKLLGNSAEWVVEAVYPDSPLADFGAAYIDESYAGTWGGNLWFADKGHLVSIDEGGGKVVTVPTIETEKLVKLTYTG